MTHSLRTAIRAAVRRWLGLDVDRERADAWADVVVTHHDALESLVNLAPELSELRANLERADGLFTQYATTLNDHARILVFHQDVLKRWSTGSEVLRSIEKTHHAKQAGGTILTLPESRIIGGH